MATTWVLSGSSPGGPMGTMGVGGTAGVGNSDSGCIDMPVLTSILGAEFMVVLDMALPVLVRTVDDAKDGT